MALPKGIVARIFPIGGSSGLVATDFTEAVETVFVGRADWKEWQEASRDEGRHAVVRFPEQNSLVGSKHLTLSRGEDGDWFVLPLRKAGSAAPYYVEVDGVAVNRRTRLRPGSVLKLGGDDGPSIRFDFTAADAVEHQNRQRTRTQKLVEDTRVLLVRLRHRTDLALRAVAVLAVVVAGIGVWVYWIGSRVVEVEITAAEQDAAVKALEDAEIAATTDRRGFDDRVVALLEQAVHLVVLTDGHSRAAIATAWPVSQTEMVTNAHVVESLRDLPEGNWVEICPPGEGPCYPVVGPPRPHPLYAEFRGWLKGQKIGLPTMEGAFRQVKLSGYDVAILNIPPGRLRGTPLEVAQNVTLSPNDEILFAGYPLRDTEGAPVAPTSRTPRVHGGRVSALTDFFLRYAENDPRRAQLVQNTIPVTGGASGGPVVNRRGEVVAIISSGEVIDVKTAREEDAAPADAGTTTAIPNAALINYAQRADVLKQLLDPPPGLRTREFAQWHKTAENYVTYRDYVVDRFLASLPNKDARGMDEKHTGTISEGVSLQKFSLKVEKDQVYSILAYTPTPEGLELKVDPPTGREIQPAPGQAAEVTFTSRSDGEATIEIVSSLGTSSSFELLIYGTK